MTWSIMPFTLSKRTTALSSSANGKIAVLGILPLPKSTIVPFLISTGNETMATSCGKFDLALHSVSIDRDLQLVD